MQDPKEQLERLKAKKAAARAHNAKVAAKWGAGKTEKTSTKGGKVRWTPRMAAKPSDAVLPEPTTLDISLRLDDAVETKGMRVSSAAAQPVDGSSSWAQTSDRRLAAGHAADQVRPSDHVICTDWDDNTKELRYYRDEDGVGYWDWKMAPKVI